jgi:lipoyl-dependent peroxiredoxin
MAAKGTAEWKGDLPSGSGTFTAGDSISGGYTFKSRFENGPGSNPEQLIAAAHAACFSMALSNILASAGSPPESVQTEATVTLRFVDGAPTISKIALVTTGRVPGIDQATFTEHAQTAKAGCPVSRALAAVPEITLEATLLLSPGDAPPMSSRGGPMAKAPSHRAAAPRLAVGPLARGRATEFWKRVKG